MRADGVLERSLLDLLASEARCLFLSDLRWLQDEDRARLVSVLEGVPAGAATLFEWNDALRYLAEAPPERTPEAARARLMQWLAAGSI